MLSLCVQRISMMNIVLENYSIVHVSMLMVAPSKIIEKKSTYRARMDVKVVPNNQMSPQMIKRPSATTIHKDPQSHQPVKTDHVENGQEGQSEPS